MKKFLLFVLMFANYSAFATDPDIAASETTLACDSDVLNSDNGPVDIEINWEPNTLQLHWYNGNTLIESVPNESQSCVYDDGLVPPSTIPTRTGYTFTGWRARPTMNFSTMKSHFFTSRNINELYALGFDILNNKNYCLRYNGHWNTSDPTDIPDLCLSDNNFSDLRPQEWKKVYDQGTLYGMAKCSAKGGDTYNNTWPMENKNNWQETNTANLDNAPGEKQYCWCKATGYKPANQNDIYATTESLPWVYFYNTDSHRGCGRNCGRFCATIQSGNAVTALLTPVDE